MSEILTVQSYITFLESAASHQKWNYIQILTFLFHVRVYTNPQCGIRILCDVRTLQCTCWRFLLPLWRFLARFQTTPLCKDVRPEFAFAVFLVAPSRLPFKSMISSSLALIVFKALPSFCFKSSMVALLLVSSSLYLFERCSSLFTKNSWDLLPSFLWSTWKPSRNVCIWKWTKLQTYETYESSNHHL